MALTRIKNKGLGTSVSRVNIVDTGTEGTKVAAGTTAQRGTTTGQWRYNSTTGFFEGRNAGGDFSTLEPAPTVTSVDVTEVDSQAGGNQTIVVTGTNFTSGGTIAFVGTSATFNASTTTHNSATQQTAVAPKASFLNAQEPYSVKFTSSSGVTATSATGLINVDTAPTWTTNSGSLGSVEEGASANFTVAATDADSDTIAYTVQSGSLPSGLTIGSANGNITGTAPSVSGDTTSSFTLRATANSKTADRQFNIIRTEFVFDGSTAAKAFSNVSAGDSHVVSGNQYYVNTASGSPEQLYFYKFGNYAYALVALRYQSTSVQTNVNTNGALNSSSNNSTWMIGVTKTNYMIGQGSYGLIMVPQQASGALAPSNTIKYGNMFRESNSSRLIDTNIFTNNNADEGTNGTSVRGVDLSTLGASSYPTNYWDDLNTNSHAGGNQILSYFSNGTNVSDGGNNPLGIRWSNNNGNGYHDGTNAGNDVTGTVRILDTAPIVYLFFLVR
jgi:hypothetical protein